MQAHAVRFTLLTLFMAAFFGSFGCLSTPRVETLIHDSPRGRVWLKELSDPSGRATHPASIDTSLMTKVLTGVGVQEQKTVVEATLTGDPAVLRAFEQSDVTFLAPLLVSALSQATREEHVHFRLTKEVSGRTLLTEGVLYADEGTLNFALTRHGLEPRKPATLSRPSNSFDRAKRWAVIFVPEAALTNRSEVIYVSSDGSAPNTLAINLSFLRQYPTPAERPTVTSTDDQNVEELEREMEGLRRSLDEQHEQLERLEQQLEESGSQ